MKTGRNEPCLCGSGKKYKNCCLKKGAPLITQNLNIKLQEKIEKFLSHQSGSYINLPQLTEEFFNSNLTNEFSAASLMHFRMVHPETDMKITNRVKKFISRANSQEKEIKKEQNPENLLKMMEQQPDPLNQKLLRNRILEFEDILVPKIIKELKNSWDDTFIEMAVKILYESKKKFSESILGILTLIKNPYTLSILCLVLGLMGPKKSLLPVWKYFLFFKENDANENFEQGPLLGLWELKRRFGGTYAEFSS